MSKDEKNAFSNKLFELTQKIFGGGTKEEFEGTVSKCDSDDSRFLIYLNADKNWVGYIGLHRFSQKIDGKEVTVFRAQAGLLPEYRRTNARMGFPYKEILKYKLTHLSEELFSFVAIINPSMYSITDKYVRKIYPSPNKKVPSHIEHVIDQCASHYGFLQKEGDSFWARTIGWYPLYSGEELKFWKTSKDRRIRFFQELNPDFLQGKGLLTLIPLSLGSLIISSIAFVYYSIRKKLKFWLKSKDVK